MITPIAGTDLGMEVTASRERSELSRDQFLQLLVTEMTTQNPLDPIDNAQFLEQLVGLQSLEQTSALTDALKTFQRFQQVSSASGLIGRMVKAFDKEGQDVEGIVTSIVIDNKEVLLKIGETFAPIENVKEILQADQGES